MDSKNLLILLVAIFVYINVYQPLQTQNKKESRKLMTYSKKLSLEKKFIQDKEKLLTFIDKSQMVLEKNKKILYSASIPNSIIFNKIQSKIKNIVQINHAKLLNTRWGEPNSLENSPFINIPYTFIVEIQPKKLHTLFKELFSFSGSITIKQMFIVKKKDILVLNMQLYLHKNKEETRS